MNPVDTLFRDLRASGGKAFMPFVPAGDPDLSFTRDLLPAVASSGASLIEVGFPFSDPIADGPVIQASYSRALEKGLKLAELFDSIGTVTLSRGWKTPLVAMASYSLMYKRGPAQFIDTALTSGLSGVVVPDLPAEEAGELAKLARDRDFKLILLVTPTTSPKRAERIVTACSGFVYVVSVVGITGERDRLPPELQNMLARLRSMTDLPLCVGFGISRPEQVRELKALADGIIVGSTLVKKLDGAGTTEGRAASLAAVQSLVRELSQALNEV
jgi:tryptophan synthase alpha chain